MEKLEWETRNKELLQWLEELQREQQWQECQGNNLSLLVGSMELELLEFQTEREQSWCKAEVLTDEKWRL